jgi:hypothetical protein
MLGALGRRQDEVTDAFFTRLKLHMDKKGYSTDDAEHVAKYFDDLEQEAVTRKNDARAARNRSAAKYFRTAPAARLFGMSESPAAKANKRSGPRSQTARSNDRGAGDEDGDPYDGIEEV